MERALDHSSPHALVDFIESILDFLPASDRKPYQKMIEDVRAGKDIQLERVEETAKNAAVVTWPRRYALSRFLQTIGAGFEWEAVLAAVRPTTRVLLKRLQALHPDQPIGTVLETSDAAVAIGPDEELEIDLVREELVPTLWEEHGESLEPMIEEAQIELEAMKKRLRRLRNQADAAASADRTRFIEKLLSLEDRIYFDGEAVPLEVLDAELQFDASDAALPPSDEEGDLETRNG